MERTAELDLPVSSADAPRAAPTGAEASAGQGVPAEREHVDVSIVLPIFDEAGHLEREVDRIRTTMDASDLIWEIVAIDDRSNDDSLQILRRLEEADPRIRVIAHARNLGSGGSRRTGTRLSRGDVVVWTDVDMTYPNDRIPELVASLDGFDQVVGARTTEEGTSKALRVPAKWAIRRLAQYLAQEDIPDLNSGFRAFRRDKAVRYLERLPNGFSCVTTMTMSFLTDGLSVGYVPISYGAREGRSKFHWYRDTRRYLLQVVRMILGYEPLRVFMPVGLLLLAFGMGKLGYDAITKDFRLATNTLLILFAAFQIISIGLLADLVVRVTKPSMRIPVDPPTDRTGG